MLYQIRHRLRRDVVDERERRQQQDGCRLRALGVVAVVRSRYWHVRRGEHESLKHHQHISPPPQSLQTLTPQNTYPVRRLPLPPSHRLHHAALLVLHVPHPVRLSRRDEHVRRPALHHPVQLLLLVDAELGRVVHRAGGAVERAVRAVDRRVDLGEEGARGSGREAMLVGGGDEGGGRGAGREEVGAFAQEGGEGAGHGGRAALHGGRDDGVSFWDVGRNGFRGLGSGDLVYPTS